MPDEEVYCDVCEKLVSQAHDGVCDVCEDRDAEECLDMYHNLPFLDRNPHLRPRPNKG